jgi:hypothetical protein
MMAEDFVRRRWRRVSLCSAGETAVPLPRGVMNLGPRWPLCMLAMSGMKVALLLMLAVVGVLDVELRDRNDKQPRFPAMSRDDCC